MRPISTITCNFKLMLAWCHIIQLLLFLILGLRWLISGYFPLSNLYESLLFLDWCLLFILIVAETKTRTKLLGAVVLTNNSFNYKFCKFDFTNTNARSSTPSSCITIKLANDAR